MAVRPTKPRASARKVHPPEPWMFDDPALLNYGGRGQIRVACRARDVIFRQGDPCDAVFLILTGAVKIEVSSARGKIGVIGILGPGDFFGLWDFSGTADRMGSAIALTDMTVIRFSRQAVERACKEQGPFAQTLMTFLLRRNQQFAHDLADQLFNSSERRLARVLVHLAGIRHTGTGSGTIPQISQDTLAAWVGTTRSRVNRFMNKFRQLGYIEYNGAIRVHSSLRDALGRD